MSILVRPFGDADTGAVRALLTASFPTSAEGELVERLERDGLMMLSFVAQVAEEVAGYAGFSRMSVVADGQPVRALALAPLAVLPGHRRRGIGGRLIEQGLAAANGRGMDLVFVLGDPDFYGRFGFTAQAAAPFDSPHRGPHWLAQWLSRPRSPAAGRADHADAFAALG